jgi:acrylyl-CoA reductase (NADPH)/3-hydroxypropionyl-CoA dehydratase/3-hydroxypropionyl-CoA synthetase
MTPTTPASTASDTPPAVTPPRANVNPLRDRAAFEAAREACVRDPGAFHGEMARRNVHWLVPSVGAHGAWITFDPARGAWTGFDARSGARVSPQLPASFEPWSRAFNDDDPPFYRWFEGGLTNACFNEVDRHVLAGHGDEPAFIFEGDRWDQSLNGGRGGPVVQYPISRKRLLFEVARAALVLQGLGLKRGDRIALNMPNIPEQVYYTEAAKRLGVLYTPVFGGFSDKTLSDRIHDAGARVVITADGGYRNAQIVAFKEVYTDAALDNYVPVEVALAAVRARLDALKVPPAQAQVIAARAAEAVAGEITVERRDVMRGVGRALAELSQNGTLDAAAASGIRTAMARALVETAPRIEAVVVVRHTAQPDLLWRPERDRWSHELCAQASRALIDAARGAGFAVSNEQELLALPDGEFVRAIWAASRPEPVDAEFPLFIIYTSGSTGKPKGVVHVHGGYLSGLVETMRIAFDAQPGEVMYVVADPGWITGQSYMIAACLASRVTSVLGEGAPVFPSAGRFASMIERYRVRIFKAGVTFLKSVMQDPQNAEDVRQHDLAGLRVATFCAEPTSPAVQQFGMQLMTPWYINSYWATEHGGIVWTHFFGNGDFPLRADAHTYPLPWVMGDVWVAQTEGQEGRVPWRRAEPGEKGEIVIGAPYPYMCRTVWGDVEHFAVDGPRIAAAWKGDAQRYAKTYWLRWEGTYAYTQGDFAIRHADGGFSLHGRSDDVINVSGHRLGTEEIEGAVLRDRQINPDSPVGNVIVVGAPHREKGLTPLAFVRPAAGKKITADDRRRLTELVRQEKGATAVPSDFIEVSQFPETRSGKYMRRMVRAIAEGAPVGDTSTLRNPEAIAEIERAVRAWEQRQRLSEEQQLFEHYRYFRVQYHAVGGGRRIAAVTVTNPPVNALNERALDELNTVIDHLARRNDVAALVFTGDGTASFVAGADIRQLLEDVHTVEEALPLPNNAHLAFRKIERMGKPCIAAINGVALGGGCEFALACHYRIAEPTATFGQPEIRLNLLPGYGGTQRLPRLLGERGGTPGVLRAIEIILGGRTVDADEAQRIGLVDRVVQEPAGVLAVAVALAREFATSGAGALAQAFAQRREQLTRWEQPGTPAFARITSDAEVARLLDQARRVGREKAAARVLEAVERGWTRGLEAGLAHEARLFAEAVADPEGGKRGIRDFLNRRSAPLPVRRWFEPNVQERAQLLREGKLLPVGAPFYPGFTPIPTHQFGFAVVRDPQTGAPQHDVPIRAEREVIIPVSEPGPNEALVYVLTSEVNFNDIWGITGIPVSPFDNHDLDYQVTGSGGVALVAALGSELRREGRLAIGDLVTIYSGQTDLLSPLAGRDPMFAGFSIQGYETDTGSHQQFLLVQGPQLHPVPPDLPLEAAGSYTLNLGTIYRALFTTLGIEPGKALFVEGAATGTGLEALKSAARSGLQVVGLVSSEERGTFIRSQGAAGALNRRDPRFGHLFTTVPDGADAAREWARAGEVLVDACREALGGRLPDYVVSHAGETAFPRSFQLLAQGGTLAFYGASSGYWFSFVGKPGSAPPQEMLRRARLRAGEAVLVYYGVGERGELVDAVGLEAIEAARSYGARIVVATATDAQREFVQSLGFGESVRGVVSIDEIRRREGADFEWPDYLPRMPDSKRETAAFKDAVRAFQERTMKPFGAAVGRLLRSADNPRGAPDLVVERAGHDALGVSTSLVKPFTGRVVYAEDLGGRRYTFYAPQVWTRQRRILMPTATIAGTHLCNAYEVARMNEMLAAGLLAVTEPTVVPWQALPEAHQAMWDNRHAGANYVCNHALPATGLTSRSELFEAWAASQPPN